MKAKDIYMYFLGALIVTGMFVIIGLLVYKEMPTTNKDLLNIVIGAFIGAFLSVVGYFYGSSKGSADKTEIISESQKPAAVQITEAKTEQIKAEKLPDQTIQP